MKHASPRKFAADSWRNRDASERRQLVNTAFVERAMANAVVKLMDKMRRDYREKAPARCMVVVGEPGVGKSTLFERYRDRSQVGEIRTETGVKRPKPVLYVERPSDATVNVCSDAMLSVLMGREIHSNGRSKEGPLETQLRVNEVELIILDDFQHAASRGRADTQSKTADFVKGIAKRTRIPVVMAGLPELATMIAGNRQLDTITEYKKAVVRYPFDTTGQKKTFRGFLEKLDALLPFDQLSCLDEDTRSGAIHLATAGLLRPLNHLIMDAADMAIDDGASCIRDRDFHASWEAGNRDASSKINPFPGPDAQ